MNITKKKPSRLERLAELLEGPGGADVLRDLESQATAADDAKAKRAAAAAELRRLRTDGAAEAARLKSAADAAWNVVLARRDAAREAELLSRKANDLAYQAEVEQRRAIEAAERSLVAGADPRIAAALKKTAECLSGLASGRLAPKLFRAESGVAELDPVPEDPRYKFMLREKRKYLIPWSATNADAVHKLLADARLVPDRLRELALLEVTPADLEKRIAAIMVPVERILAGEAPAMVTTYARRPCEDGEPASPFVE